MLRWLIRNRLNAFERKYGYDVSYMRELLDIDMGAFLAFARATKIGNYRRDVPRDVYWAAKIIGVVSEDCGPCTQLGVALALADGVDAVAISAVLADDRARMSADVKLGVEFARATLAHAPEADDLRDDITRRWGKRALVSLSLALVASRLYPTLKYALGHGKSCQRVTVAGRPVLVARSTAAA
jgi:hypothetical protein